MTLSPTQPLHRHKLFYGSALTLAAVLLPITSFAETSNTVTPRTAQSETLGINETQNGSLLFKTDTPGRYIKAPSVSTDVKMNIAGPVIRTTLSQTFQNISDEFVEGVYVFPLPDMAAVDRLRIVVGGRFIEGQIKEKKEAKAIYEAAKQEGKKASLVEQERPNIFTASVANIGPGESVAIQIEYQDTAKITDGKASVIFPMTVAPRFSPKATLLQLASTDGSPVTAVLDPVLDRHRISPPLMDPKEEPTSYIRLPVSIDVTLEAGFKIDTINSPYHTIDVNQSDEDSASIRLSEGKVPANRDFKLSWTAKPNKTPQKTIFKEVSGDDTYLMTMINPPKVQGFDALDTHARQSVFVIDTSGSMGGTSIVQARRALKLGLSQLGPQDEFNVIRFSSDHSSLYARPQKATVENIEEALRWVSRLDADGGTNMLPAMDAALKSGGEDGLLKQVVFITDGSIGNEQQLFALIQDELKDARLFPVGIGSAPNRFFMSRAAKFGRGTSVMIGDINEVDTEMGALFQALNSPVLTNLQLSLKGEIETYPSKLPDLYVGDPIISIAKVKTSELPKALKLTGNYPNTPWKTELDVNEATQAKGLSVLWARQKIADLEEQRFDRASAEKIDKAILKTALDYHLVSRLTSLVAVDVTPSRDMSDRLVTKSVPTQLPEGWDFAAFESLQATPVKKAQMSPALAPQPGRTLAMPNTASPHIFLILLGSLLLSLSGLLKRLFRSRHVV